VAAVRVLRTWRLWQPLREGELSEGENADVAKGAALAFLLLLLPLGVLGAWRAGLPGVARAALAGPALMVSVTSAIGWGAPRFLRPAELALLVCAGAWLARRRAWYVAPGSAAGAGSSADRGESAACRQAP
jgi:hypothetical protein